MNEAEWRAEVRRWLRFAYEDLVAAEAMVGQAELAIGRKRPRQRLYLLCGRREVYGRLFAATLSIVGSTSTMQ